MARQRTNKTAKKRIKVSSPRGHKRPIVLYKQSHQGHLKTKRSTRSKRRQSSSAKVHKTTAKKMVRKIINI
ncbi:MAG: hypothetical protein ACOX6Q_02570 [Candidatus Dojkabacteria bacterium]|jgi:ribosomal protein L35